MSSDVNDLTPEELSHLSNVLQGGANLDQLFIQDGQRLFAFQLAVNIYRKLEPDLAERQKYVRKFVAVLRQDTDQQIALHRQLERKLGDHLNDMAGTDPDRIAEDTERRCNLLLDYLLKVME